jgi:hypothetical protein
MMGQASSNQQNQGRDELIKQMSSLPGQYTHPQSSNQPTTHETDVKMSKTVQKKTVLGALKKSAAKAAKAAKKAKPTPNANRSSASTAVLQDAPTHVVPWKHPPLHR